MKKKESKVVDVDVAKDIEEASIDELEALTEQIEKAEAEQAKRIKATREFVLSRLKVLEEAYRTVQGYYEALQTFKKINGDDEGAFSNADCLDLAREIADMVSEIAARFMAIEPEQLDGMLEDYVEKDFVTQPTDPTSPSFLYHAAQQLMVVDLCRKASSLWGDLVEFKVSSEDELDKMRLTVTEIAEEGGNG